MKTNKCGLFFESYSEENQIFPSRFQKISFILFFLFLVFAPYICDSYILSLFNLIFIAIIGAVSLNLLTGSCGQISLGHGAFIGVGAYATAFFLNLGLNFFLALLLGGLITALIGMIFGLPSLRLKGIYLAISTLAAQLILEYIFLHWDSITGGSNGLAIDSPTILGIYLDNDSKMFYLLLGFVTITTLFITNIMRTKLGRAFVSIRDFYLSAEVIGINLFQYKLYAFGISSFFAGIAGGLWASYSMYITPEQFGVGLSISYLAMIIIGGLGKVLGSIMGAVFITLLPELLSIISQNLSSMFPDISTYVLGLKEGIFGLILILFLIFEPEGLAHRWHLIKSYFKLYPFAH
ncbi:branched-chain amino acid transport system permease protein [Desulfonauticus submarinus]|uniref:Branched-chain amino acid transport system permease protein n=1 Tax=Desulfonauticus submarinus TaxID=206665 RepID=A0A1G9ZR39_9BACT|nr:branched-chain amino acid ABC transporter permease [Desulfonauticus submarinus]SDN24042.1 branched-chain amino acid transport system permease protein [Desulfonauticus submarinus]